MTSVQHELVYPLTAFLCALVAAFFDIRTRRIPNRLVAFALPVGILLHFALDGWKGALMAALAALITGAIFLLFFLCGGMGGGDVKLIAAVGCLAGLSNIPYLLVFTSLAGGLMAITLALLKGRAKETLRNVATIAKHHGSHGLRPHQSLHAKNPETLRLPYAVAIAAGSFLTIYLPAGLR